MAKTSELLSVRLYEEAKEMLEKRDLLEFISKISTAIEVSRNKVMLAKTTYLRATGLIAFNQYVKALDFIEEALEYNTGTEAFELKKVKGVAKGYLGEMEEALKIFKELTHESNDIDLLVGVYTNIIWVYLTLKKKNLNDQYLIETKHYLDLMNQHFESLSNKLKWKVYNNYSVYYFYKNEYGKAIEFLENSIQYCKEEDLAHIYNNLAELYLKSNESDVSIRAEEYLKKAEIIGTKYNNIISLGYTFYFKAELDLREDQLFRALDTLSLSFEYFKEAGAHALVSESVLKINKLMDEYKLYLQKT